MVARALRGVQATFRFPVFSRLWKYLLPLAIYAAAAIFLDERLPDLLDRSRPRHGAEAVLTGILFGWLMSFRTTTAYSRWWEGRMLWGQLVNECRNLNIKGSRLFAANEAAVERLANLLATFAYELKQHLRSVPVLPNEAAAAHRPMAVAGEVFDLIYAERAAGRLDGWTFSTLDDHAKKLMDVCGACERIKNTPLTPSYRGLLRKGIVFYMLLLPWFLADDLGWLAVPAVVLVGYALIGLELIADGIENPFGSDGDDLPLDDLVGTIRRSVGLPTA